MEKKLQVPMQIAEYIKDYSLNKSMIASKMNRKRQEVDQFLKRESIRLEIYIEFMDALNLPYNYFLPEQSQLTANNLKKLNKNKSGGYSDNEIINKTIDILSEELKRKDEIINNLQKVQTLLLKNKDL